MLCFRTKNCNSFTTTRGNSFHCFVKKATVQIVCQLHTPVNLVLGIMNVADHHHHHSNSRTLCLIYLLQFKRTDRILLSKQCDRITLSSIFFFFFSLLPLLLNILSWQLWATKCSNTILQVFSRWVSTARNAENKLLWPESKCEQNWKTRWVQSNIKMQELRI